MGELRIPVSTYRIQFSRDFRFKDAEDLIPYLHQLGITDLYSSPRFRPRRGSSHGYDVTHPRRVNPELGSEEEFEDLCAKLKNYDMGLLLDIVPNHMAASHENEWWEDVLEHGPASAFADYFDIDWHPQITKAAFLQDGKVLVPVLGDLYGEVLNSGKLTLGLDERGIYLAYYERRFPIDSGTCSAVLEACAAAAASDGLSEAAATLLELSEFSRSIPPRENLPPGGGAARASLCRELDYRLFLLHRDSLETRLAIDRGMRELAADPARMHELLDKQAYRLAHWRIASEEINYRRFFDINDLVSLRVELPQVFEARHAALREHVEAGRVTGLRVDHVDGLYDVLQYLQRLQALVSDPAGSSPFYIVVEKIVGAREALPGDWPVSGTTGYDFLNAVNDLFIDPAGLEQLEDEHRRITGNSQPFADLCYECNRLVMRQLFAGEVERLNHELSRIAARHWMARDIPVSELKRALVEVTACLPVYRTYATDRGMADADRQMLGRTLEIARERMGASVNIAAWQFLREVLLLEAPDYDPALATGYLDFLRRWQQFTGPVMAKGLEDTAFYRNASLISRNEVGGDPLRETPPRSVEQVHEFFLDRQKHWPHTLNTTSTHDTKRSEDVRARINVLSEMPDRWARSLRQWRRLNRSLRSTLDGSKVPSADEEIRICETLLGAWPFDPAEEPEFRERVSQFLRKACREAKLHSDWLEPNEAVRGSPAPVRRWADRCGSRRSLQILVPFPVARGRVSRGVEQPQPAPDQDHGAGCAGYLSRHGTVGVSTGRSGQPAQRGLHQAPRFADAASGKPHAQESAGSTGTHPHLARWANQAVRDRYGSGFPARAGIPVRPRRVCAAAAGRSQGKLYLCVRQTNGFVLGAHARSADDGLIGERTRSARRRGAMGGYRAHFALRRTQPVDQSVHGRGNRGHAALRRPGSRYFTGARQFPDCPPVRTRGLTITVRPVRKISLVTRDCRRQPARSHRATSPPRPRRTVQGRAGWIQWRRPECHPAGLPAPVWPAPSLRTG